METTTLIVASLNLILTSVLAWKYLRLKQEVQKVHMKYFTEVTETDRLFKKEKTVAVKAQLYVDDLPIGQPFTVSENRTENVDREEINRVVRAIAVPLGKIGIKYLIK